jgi:hypothetical protein
MKRFITLLLCLIAMVVLCSCKEDPRDKLNRLTKEQMKTVTPWIDEYNKAE